MRLGVTSLYENITSFVLLFSNVPFIFCSQSLSLNFIFCKIKISAIFECNSFITWKSENSEQAFRVWNTKASAQYLKNQCAEAHAHKLEGTLLFSRINYKLTIANDTFFFFNFYIYTFLFYFSYNVGYSRYITNE